VCPLPHVNLKEEVETKWVVLCVYISVRRSLCVNAAHMISF